MKKLTAVAVAMLAVTSAANAADVYKNERMSLLRSQIRDEKTLRFLLDEAKR